MLAHFQSEFIFLLNETQFITFWILNIYRSALAACFDRESRREKYLEQRNREIRLAKKHREAKKKEVQVESEVSSVSQVANTKLNPNEPAEDDNLVLDRQFFISLADMVYIFSIGSRSNYFQSLIINYS